LDGVKAIDAQKDVAANQLFEKFAEIFPDFANGKFGYMKLEAGDAMMPLSLEYIFGDRISVMHTYELNGDLCYDPMMEFRFDNIGKTMTAVMFEQSIPPLIQNVGGKYGNGHSIDGNGKETKIMGLQSKLNDFASQWLDNIAVQGYTPVKAHLGLGEHEDIEVTFDAEGNVIMPQVEVTTESNSLMPDPTVTTAQMNEYGYGHDYDGILPLSNERAAELYDADHCVFLLYPDNTEAMAESRDEILKHDGYCGIERDDWERSPLYAAKQAVVASAEGKREADLLYGDNPYQRENKFGIYQIRNDLCDARDFRFVPMRELEALGLPVERSNYELVYTAPLAERIEFLSDRYPALNKIFQDFNTNQPADYTARSVSTSDVIVLRHNGDISAFYVDSTGFKELDSFLGEETKREHLKTPAKPEVATAERKSVSKGKPSLLGRLDEAKKQVEQNKQTAVAAKTTERGHE
jgi:hypothetical protein